MAVAGWRDQTHRVPKILMILTSVSPARFREEEELGVSCAARLAMAAFKALRSAVSRFT